MTRVCFGVFSPAGDWLDTFASRGDAEAFASQTAESKRERGA